MRANVYKVPDYIKVKLFWGIWRENLIHFNLLAVRNTGHYMP